MPEPCSQLDYSRGQVFLQDGAIFYSPNCSRPVLLPHLQQSKAPFQEKRLNPSTFKQPTWWTEHYGWLSFVPIAPSYISAPFEPFCWTPRIEEVDVLVSASEKVYETRYRMPLDDVSTWRKAEQLIVDAALIIRVQYQIQSNPPPLPSYFSYDRAHKTRAVARKIIGLARDWLSIWMGYLSYLISQADTVKADVNPIQRQMSSSSCSITESIAELDDEEGQGSPLPSWHLHLRNRRNYSDYWLDGLSSSAICSYKYEMGRAGIIIRLAQDENVRPTVEWFLDRHIPVFFLWTNVEEQHIRKNPSLSYLGPPPDLLQQALTRLFKAPDIPLAGLIMQHYYNMLGPEIDADVVKFLDLHYAPSFVREFTMKQFRQQQTSTEQFTKGSLRPHLLSREDEQYSAAQAALSSFSSRVMLENDVFDRQGRLYNHWQDFFDKRNIRQTEFTLAATQVEKLSWESRARIPDRRRASMYEWKKILSSEGHPMYMRTYVPNKQKDGVFASYGRRQKVYNPVDNEWDMGSDFDFAGFDNDSDSSASQSDDGSDSEGYDPSYNFDEYSNQGRHRFSPSDRCSPGEALPKTVVQEGGEMDTDKDENDLSQELYFSRDILEMLHYGYGYVTSMVGASIKAHPAPEMKIVFNSFGLHLNLSELDLPPLECTSIKQFFSCLMASPSTPIPSDIYDLNDKNHLALSHLVDFPAIIRSPENLFLFYAPRSQACDWLLGVHSPAVALYVCRLIISNPTAHTIVTVAKRLLEKGIQFRTLLGLSCTPTTITISDPYHAASFRPAGYHFTPQDFETAMLQCQSIIAMPQGRAALLRGGIISRIAREYSSLDGILSGPSPEVTAHRRGYITPSSAPHSKYCDDELTDQELATICGTYSVYTPFKGQESVKSWFPPSHVWNAHQNGLKWIEWTERDESFYIKRCKEILEHGGQPLTVLEWRSRMKGHKNIRTLYENNTARASVFLDQMVPKCVEVI